MFETRLVHGMSEAIEIKLSTKQREELEALVARRARTRLGAS
jgi:hypothetical protein